MTKIGMNLGGTGAIPPGGQPEKWMRPAGDYRGAIDWTDPKYQTPQPAPTHKVGKYREPGLDVPQLPERNIRVRAVPPATYYTQDGAPIPTEWVTLPISPGLIQAIKDGDLERGPDPVDEPKQQQQRQHSSTRRHTTQARPPETPAT